MFISSFSMTGWSTEQEIDFVEPFVRLYSVHNAKGKVIGVIFLETVCQPHSHLLFSLPASNPFLRENCMTGR